MVTFVNFQISFKWTLNKLRMFTSDGSYLLENVTEHLNSQPAIGILNFRIKNSGYKILNSHLIYKNKIGDRRINSQQSLIFTWNRHLIFNFHLKKKNGWNWHFFKISGVFSSKHTNLPSTIPFFLFLNRCKLFFLLLSLRIFFYSL